jgi:SsrA-binding protein
MRGRGCLGGLSRASVPRFFVFRFPFGEQRATENEQRHRSLVQARPACYRRRVKGEKDGNRDIAVNRRARHEYHIEETFEAGIALLGSEVKALRQGKANLKDSYGRLEGDEVWLWNAHISPYGPASQFGHEPTRTRKLLLHRAEIGRLTGKVKERGLTLIPLRLYFKNGRAKIELALARGKKQHDKREAIKEREMRREMDRAMRR